MKFSFDIRDPKLWKSAAVSLIWIAFFVLLSVFLTNVLFGVALRRVLDSIEYHGGGKQKVQLVLAMSRAAKLYLLDEPIGGVDPAARDYILSTILNNYSRDATVILSTHLIGDIEPILDEAVFLKDGRVFAHRNAEELRETEGMSVDAYFREVFKC